MTAHLAIWSSPRLEDLFEEFSRRVESAPRDPLATMPVVVPSQGLARWLQLRWAQRWGVAAGFEYLYPGQWARRLGRRLELDGTSASADPFDGDTLGLRIFELLPALASEHDELALYLRHDDAQRRRQQLAARLARGFGEWQLYRPDILQQWQAGRAASALHGRFAHESWLRALWRQLCDSAGESPPLGQLLLELRDRLRAGTAEDVAALEELHVFGVSSLPPVLLQVVRAAAEHVDVHLYFPAPTRSYWSGVRSRREQRLDELREPDADYSTDESDPLLLADLGRQGRDFFSMLLDLDEDGQSWQSVGEESDATPANVLEFVQAQIRGDAPDTAGIAGLDVTGDGSLLLHSCHSPRRELEVLRDELWRAFAADASLKPSDVLVLVRDMKRYAPFVRTIFDEEIDGVPRIPYSLADRRIEDREPLVRAFLRVLEVGRGRRSSVELLDLLDTPAIAARFEFDEAEIEAVRRLVGELGIRWGSDPAQRAAQWELPEFLGGTWSEGVDEALLGVMSGDVDEELFARRPAGDVAVDHLPVLAKLSRMLRVLDRHWQSMNEAQPLAAWSESLQGLLEDVFLATGDDEAELLATLRRDLVQLSESATEFELSAEWSLVALLAVLRERLESRAPAVGFLSGAVTFAEMRPLRSLPFRFLAVLGLDEGEFPRVTTRDGLDLLALHPRRGDRSARDDDRYLFLETLMAARERLHLSAVARSDRDNSERGRSLLLDEVAEVLHESFGDGARALEREHSLHAFASANFIGPADRRSFDRAAEEMARTVTKARAEVTAFDDGIPAVTELPVEVRLDELLRFYHDPAKWFCRNVLGMSLYTEVEVAESERWELDSLAKWQFGDLTLRADAQPPRRSEQWRVERSLGLARTASTQHQVDESLRAAARLRRWLEEQGERGELEIDLELGLNGGTTVRLHGRLAGWTGDSVVSASPSKLGVRDEFAAALRAVLAYEQCLLGADDPDVVGVKVAHHGKDGICSGEVSAHNAKDLGAWLRNTVEDYRQAHRRPLRLPWKLVDSLRKAWQKESPPSLEDFDSLLRRTTMRNAFEGREQQRGLLDEEAWCVLLGPRPQLSDLRDDLWAAMPRSIQPLEALQARAQEADR